MKSYGAGLLMAAISATAIIGVVAETKAVRRKCAALVLVLLSALAFLLADAW
jgi:hypothetical protein